MATQTTVATTHYLGDQYGLPRCARSDEKKCHCEEYDKEKGVIARSMATLQSKQLVQRHIMLAISMDCHAALAVTRINSQNNPNKIWHVFENEGFAILQFFVLKTPFKSLGHICMQRFLIFD